MSYSDPSSIFPSFTPEELDTFLTRQFRAYLKQRPNLPLNDLNFLKPPEWVIPTDFELKEFTVKDVWDSPIPEDFRPLLNTVVREHKGILERPVYNRYFKCTGSETVACPRDSVAVVSPINLKLSYPLSLPEGFDYVFTQAPSPEYTEGGFIYIIPRTYLEELEDFTLVVSRSKVKCDECYKVSMTFNATLYVSIVHVNPFTNRYKGTYVTPLWAIRGSSVDTSFDSIVNTLFQYWETLGYIPTREVFTLSTGECLPITYEQY